MDKKISLESPKQLFLAEIESIEDSHHEAQVVATICLREVKAISKAHSDVIVQEMIDLQTEILKQGKSLATDKKHPDVFLVVLLKGLAFASLRAMFNENFRHLIKKSEEFKRIYITIPTDLLSHHISEQILNLDDFERITFVKDEADARHRILGDV